MGESDPQALARELLEELGLRVRVEEQLFRTETVDLAIRFYRCERLGGELTLSVHDAVKSLGRDELQGFDWALGDVDFVRALSQCSSQSWPFA